MEQNEIIKYEKTMKNRPHVVILGAGASVATIPNGDLNGKKISVMDGFLTKLGLDDLLKNTELDTKSNNIEDIYNELNEKPELKNKKEKIENSIYKYFSEIKIFNNPSIYDLLILSLRSKDLIATFNWDPLLLQAYQRVRKYTNNLPDLLFLHGNVLAGICEEHKRGGFIKNTCPVCKNRLKPTKLLYPIKNKNYNSDLFIRDAWDTLKYYLSRAYILTIFGYSAPSSDVDAVELLKNAWGNKEKRNMEEIEIIDIKKEEVLRQTWKDFIHSHHYQVTNSFYDSILSRCPRRSCECLFDNLMNCMWFNDKKGLIPNMSWDEIELFYKDLFEDERLNSDLILKSFWTIKL